MYLYKSYCYATLQDVANSIASQGLLTDGQYIRSALIKSGAIQINLQNDTGVNHHVTFHPPLCSHAGFDNSFFGVTPADSVAISWLVVSVLVFAWCVKTLRRTL